MGACRRAREGESRTGCDCQGGRAGARATGSGVKCRFSAGRPAEWIETFPSRGARPWCLRFSAGRPAEWIETVLAEFCDIFHQSFSAGRPAEWIETVSSTYTVSGFCMVSPLED